MSNVYFASDFHLGIDLPHQSSKSREMVIAKWIDGLPNDSVLYLLGDIFDYWYEYRKVVPRGYTHFFSSLRKAVDRGVEIELFVGNHDMWMFDYFTDEFGIKVEYHTKVVVHQGKKLFIGHGDGLGPNDIKYKRVKKILRNKYCQRLFKLLHPDFALKLMSKVSHTSRDTADDEPYEGEDEWLVHYANRKLDTMDVDYFVFGHRHLLIDYKLKNGVSRYFNLGDWVNHQAYGKLENGEFSLCFIDQPKKIYTI